MCLQPIFQCAHEVFPVCSEYLAKLPIASSAMSWLEKRYATIIALETQRLLPHALLYFWKEESMNLCIMPDMSAVAKTAATIWVASLPSTEVSIFASKANLAP
jgi:hypothetical protein